MAEFNLSVKLWKIGNSVVFTVPSAIRKSMDLGGIHSIVGKLADSEFIFDSKPWHFGSSYVITVPSSHIKLYNLKENVKHRIPIDIKIQSK